MEVDGSYLVARTLKEEGVEHLFFLMGGPNYEIINNSEDFGIKVTDFRHEQAASMAAHAYARVTGKPGVTTAASGPGTLNLLTGQEAIAIRHLIRTVRSQCVGPAEDLDDAERTRPEKLRVVVQGLTAVLVVR